VGHARGRRRHLDGLREHPRARGLGAEIALIPLVGHSRGHTGIAVRDGDGWLLHCGDAYFHRGQMAAEPTCPPGLRAFQTMMAADRGARLNNEQRPQPARPRARRRGAAVLRARPVELEAVA